MIVSVCVQAGQRKLPDRFVKFFLGVIDSSMEIVRKIFENVINKNLNHSCHYSNINSVIPVILKLEFDNIVTKEIKINIDKSNKIDVKTDITLPFNVNNIILSSYYSLETRKGLILCYKTVNDEYNNGETIQI